MWNDSKLNLLTLQGRPKHTHGNRVTHTTFPLSFRFVDQGHPPRLQSTQALHPHVCACEQTSKRVREKSTLRANQVLKLTDYHISRHVVSTFKCLTTTTTHCGLSIFSLNRRGLPCRCLPPSLLRDTLSSRVRR